MTKLCVRCGYPIRVQVPHEQKIPIRLDDPETRRIWESALEARRRVASWPNWKANECRCQSTEVNMIVEIDYTNYKGIRSLRRIQPKQIKFETSEWHPEAQWIVEALDLEKNEIRTFAMKDIHSWTPVVTASTMELAIAWLRDGDTGTSSETILEVMTGIPVKRHDIPYDPSDFGRCYRLLQKFPEWKPKLRFVAERFPVWTPFVDNWPEMEKIYERDEPTGASSELYDMMVMLRGYREHWTEQMNKHKKAK